MPFNSSENMVIHVEPDIPLSVIWTLTVIVIILANMYVIIVIVNTQSLHTPSGFLMASLAGADFTMGVSHNVPLWYADVNGIMKHEWFVCQFSGVLIATSYVASIYTLGLLSVDKYIAITRPLRYHEFVTRSRCLILIVLVWLGSVVSSIPPLFNFLGTGYYSFEEASRSCYLDSTTSPYYALIGVGSVFGIISMVIGFCYFNILKISLTQSKNLALTSLTFTSDNDKSLQKSKIMKTNSKAIRTLLIIILAFYVAWTPFLTEMVIRGFIGHNFTPDWLLVATSTLAISNSYLNAFIHTLTNKKFRLAAIKIFMPYLYRNRVSPIYNDMTTQ